MVQEQQLQCSRSPLHPHTTHKHNNHKECRLLTILLYWAANTKLQTMHQFYVAILLICCWSSSITNNIVDGTHITGTFSPHKQFFKFLIKFGFQKTELHEKRESFGYIFGNVTAANHGSTVQIASDQPTVTLAVLEKWNFLQFYGNRSIANKNAACQRMLGHMDTYTYHSACNTKGISDYFRSVPCPVGGLCREEDAPENGVPGNQFTYVISDLKEPRYVVCVVI